MKGTYVYAILAGEARQDLGPIGLPDGTAPVVTLPMDGLTAVVSDYVGPAFHDLPKLDLLKRLVVHQRVIECAMTDQSVLPVQFGTVLSSQDEVRAALSQFRLRLGAALAGVAESAEIDLSARWDAAAMLADVAHDSSIAALAGTSATAPPEQAMSRRLHVGMLVHESLAQRRDDYRKRIVGELVSFARDAQPHPLPAEDVVLNVAFLVERAQLDRFEAAVDRLGADFSGRLAFRYVGPLPPYSFATVEITRPDPGAIEAARRLLGLDRQCSEATLRTAYRRHVAQHHPDRHPAEPAAQHRFAALTAANGALHAYMRRQRDDDGRQDDDRHYDLAPDAVARALLLEIKRADTQPSPPMEIHHESGARI